MLSQYQTARRTRGRLVPRRRLRPGSSIRKISTEAPCRYGASHSRSVVQIARISCPSYVVTAHGIAKRILNCIRVPATA
eukprot:3004550-Rhodomonas_salina.7